MNPFVSLTLQALILGAGIYVALGFLRSTRGGGIVRGLVVALLFGAVGLWGLAELLRLEELGHILQSITGYVVVILVILFQPELRRGIAQLGEQALLGQRKRNETANEIAQAAIAMARRRRGALIAIERDFSLDAYVDNAVRVDGQVTRLLIESIFHPGSALHDGAIVLRGDRIAAAASLFPLTENLRISSSTGTRHRAALGLTEETDAVTLVVSEETGEIALCRSGEMQSNVSPDRLEAELSMIRYISWAIPSVGFIGTVRGIGEALAQADRAVQGDIAGVTQSLGVAFNSTFIALMISIFLMFLVHQLTLMQERLVFDTEAYCDDRLVRHMYAEQH